MLKTTIRNMYTMNLLMKVQSCLNTIERIEREEQHQRLCTQYKDCAKAKLRT